MSGKDTEVLVFPITLDPFSGYKYKKETCNSNSQILEATHDGGNDSKFSKASVTQNHPLGRYTKL